jgi:hypothetical protein
MENNLRKKNNFNGLTIKIIFYIRLEEPQENTLGEPIAFPYIYREIRVVLPRSTCINSYGIRAIRVDDL